jgi:iron-sulfur cluster assembly protein
MPNRADDPIQEIRAVLGDPPRSLFHWRKMVPPLWLAARPDDLVAQIYATEKQIFRNGELRWAAIVHANETMWRPEPGRSYSGAQIVYAAHGDATVDQLTDIAARCFALKGTKPENSLERRLADMLTNEYERALDWSVPGTLTGGLDVLTTIVMLPRDYLPGAFLVANWFPIIADPESKMALLVSSRFWPAALRAAWRNASAGLKNSAASKAHLQEHHPRCSAPVTLTRAAAEEVQRVFAASRFVPSVAYVRVFVTLQSGGGFVYGLDVAHDGGVNGDQVFQSHGLTVRVDSRSLPYLAGTTIDFVDRPANKGFVFRNPNAKR